MKILQIASIFPVKDAPRENPYVQNFVAHYMGAYGTEMDIVKPVGYLPAFLAAITNKKKFWRNKRHLCRKKTDTFRSCNISFWPYISVGSISSLHTFFSSFVFWRNHKKLRKLDISKYELVHAHFLFPDGMIAYQLHKKFGISYILTMQQELRFLENSYSLRWVKKIVGSASAVTTLSPQMVEGLKEKGINNVHLLSLGIEGYFFGQKQSTVSRKDKEDKLRLLSVCNLLPVKNLESVIRAISKMPEKEQIDYTIYGTGPLEQELKELVSELQLDQVIHFKGAIENKKLPAVMPEYDVFIQPSFKETLGMTYFEALACGLPVILTKNTGAYEMIKDKDVYYMVDPHDTDSVSKCLQGIINDRKTLARKAILSPEAAKIASWEGFVEFFHEKYKQIAFNSEEIRRPSV